MTFRTAKLALLGVLVAMGLSPVALSAQQRETKQASAASKKKADDKAAKPDKEAAGKSAAAKTGSDAQAKDRISVTPEREAAVMTFVKRNHAELSELLAHLKANQPKEYDRAIRELYRASERLTQIQDRDKTQYDLELRLWKTQSRIQLLTARIQMGESEDLRRELRELLSELVDNRAALLKHDREKAANRLAKIDEDLQRLENDREKIIQRQLQSLTGAGKAKKSDKPNETSRTAKGSTKSSDSSSSAKVAE